MRSRPATCVSIVSCQRPRGSAGDLRGLGGLGADEQARVRVDVSNDGFVELVAADLDRFPHHDPAQREHRHLGRAASDVHDHRSLCLGDGQARSDCGGHRLLDQRDPAYAGGKRCFLDCVPLDIGDAARHAEDDMRVREAAPAADAANEVAQHLGGDVEVRDHTVAERADRADRRRRAPDHAASLLADRVNAPGYVVDRNDGRLEHRDALAPDEHERVRRAEINRKLTTSLETPLCHRPRSTVPGRLTRVRPLPRPIPPARRRGPTA